jgi:hypothetical protein
LEWGGHAFSHPEGLVSLYLSHANSESVSEFNSINSRNRR